MQGECLNCNASYSGNFCPQCGQKHNTHRITLGAIIHDIPHSIFHVDKGVFYTFRELLYRPGIAIKHFIAGKRVRHFSPFAYLFLLCAVGTFISHQRSEYLNIPPGMNELILFPKAAIFFDHYPALMLCLLVPFISFWSWLFNLDAGYNYWENLILNTFLIAQFNLFYIAFDILAILRKSSFHSVTPVILAFMAYMVLAYLQFFKRRLSFFRAIRHTVMFIFIALTFITGLTLTGFMTPWWNF